VSHNKPYLLNIKKITVMSKTDYISSSYLALGSWLVNLVSVSRANQTRFGILPFAVDALQAQSDGYIAANTAAESPAAGKPDGVHGCEIRWAVLDMPPAQTDDLVHSAFSTRLLHLFEFEGNQRGKRFYFRGRWENTRGQKGPWGEIGNAVIP
jgi:hypothetical protein